MGEVEMSRFILGVAALIAGLSGCAGPAHYVEKNGDSGVVAIPTNTNVWPTYYETEAMALIRKHVGSNFEIVHEGLAATGKATVNNERINTDKLANSQSINNTTTTQDVTEWRIVYRKKAMPGPLVNDAMSRGLPINHAPVGGVQTGIGMQPAGGTQPAGGLAPTNGGLQSAGGPLSPVGAGAPGIPTMSSGPLAPMGGPGGYVSGGAVMGQMR
jgi:hypothetical protein